MKINYWECMAKGNEDAFLTIYQDNYKALFYYGFSLTCDKELTKDCIQELFLEIWNSKASLNKEVQNVRSYLCTWLRRKISHIRSRQVREKFSEEFTEGPNCNEASYEELLIAFQQSEEKKEILGRALNQLTKKQLEIIRLKFFENLSYSAIAVKTSLTNRTIYNLVYEAIRQLREEMSLVVKM